MIEGRYQSLFGDHGAPGRVGLDQASLRQQNLSLILRGVWCAEETSRASLARETGLSRSAISTLVEPLLELGLLEEGGTGVSTGGRKPRILRFRFESRFILGVDLGASHVSVAATDLKGQVKGWRTSPCPVRDEPLEALQCIQALSESLIEELGVSDALLLGVGLAVPSPVSQGQATKLSPLFMPRWSGVDLSRDLKRFEGHPLLIENDANAGALAEAWWGLGESSSHLAFLKLGTGLGAGFIVHGEIFKGHSGLAGELGHMVMNPEGALCVCGLRGCLATYVGSEALLKRARGLWSQSLGEQHVEEVYLSDIAELIDQLREGHPVAREVIQEAGEHLGLAVAGLMSIMNPERVVLGGALAEAGDALLHPLREQLQSRSLWTALSNSRILTSQLGERGVALGAATLVLQSALTQPERFFSTWGENR